MVDKIRNYLGTACVRISCSRRRKIGGEGFSASRAVVGHRVLRCVMVGTSNRRRSV